MILGPVATLRTRQFAQDVHLGAVWRSFQAWQVRNVRPAEALPCAARARADAHIKMRVEHTLGTA